MNYRFDPEPKPMIYTEREIKKALDGIFYKYVPAFDRFDPIDTPEDFTGDYHPPMPPPISKEARAAMGRRAKRGRARNGRGDRLIWTPQMDERLIGLRNDHVSIHQCSDIIGVSRGSIQKRMDALRDEGRL